MEPPGRSISELDLLEKSRDLTTAVATTTTRVCEVNKHRTALFLTNDSDTIIYLAFGRAAVLNLGIRLNAAGGSLELNKDSLFKGEIHAIHGGAGTKILTGIEIETRYAY